VSPLNLGTISTTDAQFNITSNPQNTTLDPGTNTTLSIEFCPAAAGAQSAQLTIGHNAVNQPNPITIDLSGTGN
jgi:hypothetical protein